MRKIKSTVTTMFMVPTLRIPKNTLLQNGFINAYSRDSMRGEEYLTDPTYENSIYLLFKPTDLDKFREFMNSEYQRQDTTLFEDYDYEGGFVILVYRLKEEFSEDYALIRKGKYSKTSEKFQKTFPRTVTVYNQKNIGSEEVSLQTRIFEKTEDLVAYWEDKIGQSLPDDFELWSIFDYEKETLNLNNIKDQLCTTT